MLLTLIRHGESVANCEGTCAGWRDVPLSLRGESEARSLAQYLSGQNRSCHGEGDEDTPVHFTAIYASSLRRAAHTAQVIYEAQPLPRPKILYSNLLWERSFGDVEGKVWQEIDEISLAPGRNSSHCNGESLNDVCFPKIDVTILIWPGLQTGRHVHSKTSCTIYASRRKRKRRQRAY